ncbi:MAG: hypothetical protein PHU93_03135 [Candidatus Gracilibacteria bacterium]|nr:hypothetical protein [Candidatus Gracilibacteria bacterium]
MKHTKSIIASVLLVGALATTSVFAANSMGMTSKLMSQKSPFTNATVIKALQDKGITVPTPEEAKAFQTKMQTMHDAEKSLSEADKASYEALRQSFKKQERDFLRSKGIVLPTEDEIAKMELIKTTLGDMKGTMMNGSGSLSKEGRGMMGGREKDKDGKSEFRGPRGGMMGGSGSTMPGNSEWGKQRGEERGHRGKPQGGTASGTTAPAPTPTPAN